ncbi:MAG: nucleoside recognition domain-containing protein [Pseudomonadales bacterium]
MFGIYLFGILMGLLVTASVSRVGKSHHDDLPFVLEMPPYRLPGAVPLLRGAWDRSKYFVTKAGPVIFFVTLVVRVLGYLPNGGTNLAGSWLGIIGHWIEPFFQPLGLDWKYGVAIITAFLAREVFVGTPGTLFGLENAEDNIISLAEHVQNSGLPLASGVALLVFFAIALQCISTMAILSKESGSWRLPAQLFVVYFLLAYCLAWFAFQAIQLWG